MDSSDSPERALLEVWFDFASTYSYLGVLRAEETARLAGLRVAWRPFLLGPLFAARGMNDSPFKLDPQRGAYMMRDVERLCERHGLAWRVPSQFPVNSVLAARLACFAQEQPWAGDFIRSVFVANFGEDRDISSEAVLRELLQRAGEDGAQVFARALADENRGRLRQQTARAQELGVFGAPTFFVGGEMFWGQDRLEDALAWASSRGTP